MTTTLLPFTPSTTAVFSFQPTLNGVLYNATVTWNVFGQDYYLNLTDLSGNLILATAVAGSGPQLQGLLSWSDQPGAMAVTTLPHEVPIGSLVNLRVSQTGTAFDGFWQALATTPTTLTYALSNPNEAVPVPGIVDFPLNMVASVVSGGFLAFHDETQQFEFS